MLMYRFGWLNIDYFIISYVWLSLSYSLSLVGIDDVFYIGWILCLKVCGFFKFCE